MSRVCAKLSEYQKAYIAGFLDGEGCFTISFRRAGPKSGTRGCHRIVVHACNTRKPAILALKRWTRIGRIHAFNVKKERNRKQTWQWLVWTREATSLLVQIQDYLIIKRRQCKLLLRFAKLIEKQPYNFRSSKQWGSQVALCSQIRRLNKRGA